MAPNTLDALSYLNPLDGSLPLLHARNKMHSLVLLHRHPLQSPPVGLWSRQGTQHPPLQIRLSHHDNYREQFQ